MNEQAVEGFMADVAAHFGPIPDAVAIDANGNWWRVWGEDPAWSMVPTNPDNSPIPQPVKFYRLVEIEGAP